jgi:hypothetical protein
LLEFGIAKGLMDYLFIFSSVLAIVVMKEKISSMDLNILKMMSNTLFTCLALDSVPPLR